MSWCTDALMQVKNYWILTYLHLQPKVYKFWCNWRRNKCGRKHWYLPSTCCPCKQGHMIYGWEWNKIFHFAGGQNISIIYSSFIVKFNRQQFFFRKYLWIRISLTFLLNGQNDKSQDQISGILHIVRDP